MSLWQADTFAFPLFSFSHSDISEISWHYAGIRDTSSHLHKFALAVEIAGWNFMWHTLQFSFPAFSAWLNFRVSPIDLLRRRIFTPSHNCLLLCVWLIHSLFAHAFRCVRRFMASSLVFHSPTPSTSSPSPLPVGSAFCRATSPAALIHVKFMQIAPVLLSSLDKALRLAGSGLKIVCTGK